MRSPGAMDRLMLLRTGVESGPWLAEMFLISMPPECSQFFGGSGRDRGSSDGVSSENDRIRETAPIDVSSSVQKLTRDFKERPRAIYDLLVISFRNRTVLNATYNIH